METDMNLNANIDKLGYLKAQIADLEKQAKGLAAEILEELKSEGLKDADGQLFRAVVVESESESVDWKSIALKLSPSRQLVKAYSKPAYKCFVKINARKKEAA